MNKLSKKSLYLLYIYEKNGLFSHLIGIFDSYDKAKKIIDSKEFQEEYEAPFLSIEELYDERKKKPQRYAMITLPFKTNKLLYSGHEINEFFEEDHLYHK